MPAAIKTGPSFLDMLGLSKPVSEIPDKIDAPTLEPPSTIPFSGGATWKGLGAGLLEGAGNFYKNYVNDPTNVETSEFGAGGALAAPLVTLYKDAKGVPSQSLRRYFTELFLKEAKAHGKDAERGAERLVKRYPRATSLEEVKPEVVANKGAYKNTEALVMPDKSDKFGRKPIYFTEKGRKAIQGSPDKATELLGHETFHVATDALTPGGMMPDYNLARNTVPYSDIPHEITAFARGNKLERGDYRAPVNRMGDVLGKYGPDAEKTFSDSIDAMNSASLNRYGELRNSPILTSQQRKLAEIRSTPQFTTARGMENLSIPGANVRDISPFWKLDNQVDPEGMSLGFKQMMKTKYGKEYPYTNYSPEGTASHSIVAPWRLPRNKVRPPRWDFNPSVLSD